MKASTSGPSCPTFLRCSTKYPVSLANNKSSNKALRKEGDYKSLLLVLFREAGATGYFMIRLPDLSNLAAKMDSASSEDAGRGKENGIPSSCQTYQPVHSSIAYSCIGPVLVAWPKR
ncbi:hypothetical protein PanWU01x14_051570 [Parasponia andersonii]|uniref:Uncharacterized protein n=1 Tax=Parasponia andersonii TaxID=3476 RepID=A0A2P5DM19_PARAD|nr:hypothetical protein PanWU01x14_051570 [Parasponia andersonii]